MARRHVTVVLSGDGGDELFAGYDRYLPHPLAARFDALPLPGKGALARAAARALPHGARGQRFLRHVGAGAEERYIDAISLFGPADRAALCARSVRLDESSPEDAIRERFARLGHLPLTSRFMRVDFETYLPEDVLTKVDRMSMAHSIESRVPLLDHPLVEFAMRLPLASKLRDGERKFLLRRVAARMLPPPILARRKQGFGVPLGVWFRGTLRDSFSDVLTSPRTRQRGYFEPREVQRLLDEHLGGVRDHELRLWQLLMFELWHRAYVDRAAAEVEPAALALSS